jgi:hypothetical protein
MSRTLSYTLGFHGPASGLAALCFIGPLFAILFVANRLYWRFRILGKLWYDDWCIILATVRALLTSRSVD